ncbi:MAG: hypothetical protein RLZZ316_1065 [Bacteroidota bacterium]
MRRNDADGFVVAGHIKKLPAHKPDSVSKLSFICFANYFAKSICLPSSIRRAVFRRWYTWHFSIQGLPAGIITYACCELLPHIFTLTLLAQGSYFLWHFLLVLGTTRLFTGVLPCAVQTFLPVIANKTIVRLVVIFLKEQLQKYSLNSIAAVLEKRCGNTIFQIIEPVPNC